MSIINEFSKHAKYYQKYSLIQRDLAKELLKLSPKMVESILELGCGSGTLFKEIKKSKKIFFKEYIAIDISKEMLKLHPKESNLRLKNIDFDSNKLLNLGTFDLILSNGAIQWSKDIEKLSFNLSKISKEILISFFTSNTFKELHKIVNVTSPILSFEKISSSFNQNFHIISLKKLNYRLYFDNPFIMLKFIKKSGIGGGVNLTFLDIKKILREYSLNYLEFECAIMQAKSKINTF